MDKEKLISFLKAKPDLNLFVDEVIQNKSNLDILFEIVNTETSSIKYACSKIIRLVSELRPDLIYPYFENVTKWLHHKNSFIKWDGILILSNLSEVDHEDKFKAVFEVYFGLIDDPQMITAANVIGNAWKIVLANPELESEITRRLLKVPQITYLNKGEPSPECNCIVCGQVLECFEKYFEHSKHQVEIINFAKAQLDSSRKSVAKKAEKFLMTNDVLLQVRNALKENLDEKTKASSHRFFKEEIKSYGVKTATVTQISKVYYKKIESRSKSEIFDLCEELWSSGYIEETFVACHWSYHLRDQYEPSDFQTFENWILNYVDNWASCDTLCNHTVGTFLVKYPEYLEDLKEFTSSENRWMRRAAAVSLIVPARKGIFLKEILEIASLLLLDQDDLVQKGYGWMLKAASEAHQQEIFDFVMSNKNVMPRTALRYAIEKMPKDLKAQAMLKR